MIEGHYIKGLQILIEVDERGVIVCVGFLFGSEVAYPLSGY